MDGRPMPMIGALLGLLLGAITMALLWITGVVPPDRLPLFGLLALGVIGVGALLTQRMSMARGRFTVVMVLSALLGGVALTGIPEFVRGGSLSDTCDLVATSSLEDTPVAPGRTSAFRPFEATPDDTVVWEASSDAVLTSWQSELSLMVGGIPIPVWDNTYANEFEVTEFAAEESVAEWLDAGQDRTSLRFTGFHHVVGTLQAEGGQCEVDVYVRVQPTTVVDGLLLIGLWVLLAGTLVAIAVLAVTVSRSFRPLPAPTEGRDGHDRGGASRGDSSRRSDRADASSDRDARKDQDVGKKEAQREEGRSGAQRDDRDRKRQGESRDGSGGDSGSGRESDSRPQDRGAEDSATTETVDEASPEDQVETEPTPDTVVMGEPVPDPVLDETVEQPVSPYDASPHGTESSEAPPAEPEVRPETVEGQDPEADPEGPR